MTQAKKDLIYKAAVALLMANNTVTTLEIKVRLRKDVPNETWYQDDISDVMAEFQTQGKFDFVDTGTYRVYSGTPTCVPQNTTVAATAPAAKRPVGRPRKNPVVTSPTVQIGTPTVAKPKKTVAGLTSTGPVKYISRVGAKKMMANNKGHFFTAVFTKKDQSERIMNCQYLKDQTGADLGYIKVNEASLVRQAKKTPYDTNGKKIQTIRNLNLQTLKAVKIGGQLYKVR